MAFSLGSAAFSAIFGALQNYLGTVQALHASAALIFPICALGTVLLEWPHSPPISAPGQTLDLQHHRDMFPKLGWHHLLYLPPFWLYIFVIFTAQAGYAFILYFFSMGHKFGQSSHVVLIAFQCIAVVSTLSRPAFGLITNTFKTTSGIFSMASTNMMLVMLFAQAGLYFLLIPISDASSFWAFCVTVGLLLVGFSGGACAISTLAHEQFGIENSSLILGVGGSISMGLGESFAIALVSAFLGDDISSGNASSYNVYYVMAGFWSIFGVFSCVGIIWLRVHGYTCATYLEEEKGEIKCWATDSSDLKGNSVDSFTGYGTMVQDDV